MEENSREQQIGDLHPFIYCAGVARVCQGWFYSPVLVLMLFRKVHSSTLGFLVTSGLAGGPLELPIPWSHPLPAAG